MAKEKKAPAAEPESLSEWLDKQEAAYAKVGDPPQPPEKQSWGSYDPVTHGVNWLAQAYERLTPQQRAFLNLPAGPTPDWLKSVARFAIPQNTPEALLDLAMLPAGGPLGVIGRKVAAKTAAKLAQTGAAAAIKRALARGALTATGGYATGHDPRESGVRGVVGSLFGDTVGAVAKKAIESSVAKRISETVSPKLAKFFKNTIGRWLDEGKTDADILADVVADRPSKKVGAAIGLLKERLAKKPVKALDLKPVLTKENGVIYVWPSEAGPFPKGIGAGVEKEAGEAAGEVGRGAQDLGTVWPPIREFEKKLTPGRDIMPFGAVERPGGLVPTTPPGPKRIGAGEGGAEILKPDEVEFGPLWQAVDDAYQQTSLAFRQTGDGTLAVRLQQLEDVRQKLVDRMGDIDLKNLYKEYGLTKSFSDLFWGARKAPRQFGEKVGEDLFDDKTGHLTEEGVRTLYYRLKTDAPNIEQQVGPHMAKGLGDALNIAPGKGLAAPRVGHRPDVRFHPGPGGLHPTIGLESGQVSSYPGWEAARTPLEALVPDALKVLTGGGAAKVVPGDVLTPQSAEAAEETPPGPVSIPPAKLQSPYAVSVAPPPVSPRPPIERPPPQDVDVVADWFKGEAAPKGESPPEALEVSLSTARVPGEKEPE